ncbi:hypothetical protein JW890_08420 [candidate division WOR-3 bacterium]|nr:hypothetical protein [candidate division WOR-3 bacterium]
MRKIVLFVLLEGFAICLSSSPLEELEMKIFVMVNNYRESLGLKTLEFDERILQQCREHSRAMAALSSEISHEGFETRVKNLQKHISLLSAGENVASNLNTPDPCSSAVTGWINSPHHRENMTKEWDLSAIGISVSPEGKFYFTQIFVLLRDEYADEIFDTEEIEKGIETLFIAYRISSGKEHLARNDTLDFLAGLACRKFGEKPLESGEIFSELNDSIESYFDYEGIVHIVSTNSGLQNPSEEIFEYWLSDGHYRSRMEENYDLFGVGVISTDDGKYIAVMLLVKCRERK